MNFLEQILEVFPSKGEQFITVLGGALAYFFTLGFGSFTPQICSLFVMLVADYASGLLCAIKNGELSSEKASRGFVKKTLICSVVALGHQIDIACSSDLCMSILISGYCINEGLSIVENLCRAGYQSIVPESIYQVLEILKDKTGQRLQRIRPNDQRNEPQKV